MLQCVRAPAQWLVGRGAGDVACTALLNECDEISVLRHVPCAWSQHDANIQMCTEAQGHRGSTGTGTVVCRRDDAEQGDETVMLSLASGCMGENKFCRGAHIAKTLAVDPTIRMNGIEWCVYVTPAPGARLLTRQQRTTSKCVPSRHKLVGIFIDARPSRACQDSPPSPPIFYLLPLKPRVGTYTS